MKLSDEIENRKLNGEKRNKWREIRQARCARLAPPAPLQPFSACLSVAVTLQAMRVCLLAAALRPSAAAPLAARPPAAPAPPAPLGASFGRTAILPNPASLAGDDASAARYTH